MDAKEPFFTESDFYVYVKEVPQDYDPLTPAERLAKVANTKVAPLLARVAFLENQAKQDALMREAIEEQATERVRELEEALQFIAEDCGDIADDGTVAAFQRVARAALEKSK